MARQRAHSPRHNDGTTTARPEHGRVRWHDNSNLDDSTTRTEKSPHIMVTKRGILKSTCGPYRETKRSFRFVGKNPPIRCPANTSRSPLVTPNDTTARRRATMGRRVDQSTTRRPNCTRRRSAKKQPAQSTGNKIACAHKSRRRHDNSRGRRHDNRAR